MCMFLTVALCGHVHGKGQHQLGQGERSLKEVLFSRPREQTWLATHHRLSCCQLCSRAWRGIPGPIQALSQLVLPVMEPATPHFTSRGNHQILSQNDPLQPSGLLLWLGAYKALVQTQEILHLPNTASPTSELSSKGRLPYTCIIGLATTPTYSATSIGPDDVTELLSHIVNILSVISTRNSNSLTWLAWLAFQQPKQPML